MFFETRFRASGDYQKSYHMVYHHLICTLFFSLIILSNISKLEQGLCEMERVIAIHVLHMCLLTLGKVLLACHVTITPEVDATLLNKVIKYIKGSIISTASQCRLSAYYGFYAGG